MLFFVDILKQLALYAKPRKIPVHVYNQRKNTCQIESDYDTR
ncbi:hypothetical protein HMPREF0765_4059 [Sphingobacterium spiritivorum ATCC 33300]|uniref:Uncharacterized protein n=1 Tax=Sphingobacterium spiritivorum ATCC 33300 TaxID=525372 RepID=C2G3A3_SPHSI|nr:hypothetical protein HMPREF0765_4059 [Sphingobacterium spiritivorum ATCC 33300]